MIIFDTFQNYVENVSESNQEKYPYHVIQFRAFDKTRLSAINIQCWVSFVSVPMTLNHKSYFG